MRAGPALPMSPHPKGPLSEAEQACPGVPMGGGRRPRQGSPAVGSRGLRADLCVTAQQGSGQVPKPRQACLLVHVGTTRTAGGSRGEVLGAGGRTPPSRQQETDTLRVIQGGRAYKAGCRGSSGRKGGRRSPGLALTELLPPRGGSGWWREAGRKPRTSEAFRAGRVEGSRE